MSCPNCRGAGSIIAVWNYIDETRITQQIGGYTAENLLTRNAQTHDIGTPHSRSVISASSGSQTPQPYTNGVIEEVFRDLNPINNPLPPRPAQATPQGEPTAYGPGHLFVTNKAYHIQTQLPDGRKSLLIDPGSVGNLCGDQWAKSMAQEAARNNRVPKYTKRQRALKVGGVGNGTQTCGYDCNLPVAFRHADKDETMEGHINIPTVHNSELPGLLGLTALRKNGAILDLRTLKVYFTGPGDYDLMTALPPGTESFQAEIAPSGHMVLPCCEFGPKDTPEEHTLTLVSRPPGLEPMSRKRNRSTPVPPPPEAPPPIMPSCEPSVGPPPATPESPTESS